MCLEVSTQMDLGLTVVKRLNCSAHCPTEVWFGQSTIVLLAMVHADAMPTSVLPAPQGSTIIPDRARPFPKSLERLFSWYGRREEGSRKLISSFGSAESCRKSYSCRGIKMKRLFYQRKALFQRTCNNGRGGSSLEQVTLMSFK